MEDVFIDNSLVEIRDLITVLLDLLMCTFDSRQNVTSPLPSHSANSSHSSSSKFKRRNSTSDVTPILLSMQLVSISATFYQGSKVSDEQLRYSNEENDRIMSKIPHDAIHFNAELLGHIRILIVRAVVSVCYAAIMEDSNLEELAKEQSIMSFISSSKRVLKQGGLIVEDEQLSHAVDDQNKSTPQVEISSSKPVDDEILSEKTEFVFKTMKSLFESLAASHSSNLVNSNQISDLVSLLQEFDRCGGYSILLNVINKAVQELSLLKNEEESSLITPRKHTLDSGNESSSSVRQHHTSSSSSYTVIEWKMHSLLKAVENVLRAAKRSKTEYIHQVTCTKRSHWHCDLSSSFHQHHDIMGLSIAKCLVRTRAPSEKSQNKTRWSFHGPSWGAESPKSKTKRKHKNKRAHDEFPSPCIIARGIKFLVNEVFSSNKSCAKIIMTTIDRIGICHCAPPSSILVPLLSSLPQLNESDQDIVLATVGRLLLQRMETSSKSPKLKKSSLLEEGILTVELSSALSTIPLCAKESIDGQKSKRVNPFNLPDSPRYKNFNSPSKYPRKQTSEQFEMFLKENEDFPYLCLSTYRDLMLPDYECFQDKSSLIHANEFTLSVKVASHLASVAFHFDSDALLKLLTTGILPVLRFATGYSDFNDSDLTASPKRKKNLNGHHENSFSGKHNSSHTVLHLKVILHCLEILKFHIGKSPDFRRVFVRHSGIRPVADLLLMQETAISSTSGETDTKKFYDWKDVSAAASSVLTLLFRNETNLFSDSRILVLQELHDDEFNKSPKGSPRLKRKGQESDEIKDSSMLNTFMRGLSPLKSFSPRQQRRLSPFRNNSPDRSSKDEKRSDFSWSDQKVDEVQIFHSDVKYFLSRILCAIIELTTYQEEDELDHMDNGYSDSEDENAAESSFGYQTRGRDSSATSINKQDDNDAVSLDNDSYVLNLDIDNISLPVKDLSKMQVLCNHSDLLSIILQDNKEVQDAFFKLDGPDMILRILTQVTASFIPGNSRLDITTGSSETSSIKSLLQSVEEQSKNRNRIAEMTSSSSSGTTKSNSATPDAVKTSADVKEKMLLTSKEDKGVSFQNGEEDVITDGEKNIAEENMEIHMKMKFQLFSHSLSISLLTTRNETQTDTTREDIISAMKPLLQQSQLARSKYCSTLCKYLFESAVQRAQPTTDSATIASTMSSLRQKITSPRRSTVLSPGHQRFSYSYFPSESPIGRKSEGKRRGSLDSADLNSSEADDTSSVYDMMLNIDLALGSDDENTTDGYQGDVESDKADPVPFSSLSEQELFTPYHDCLIKEGTICNPELTALMVELLGDAGKEKSGSQQSLSSTHHLEITPEEYTSNVRAVLHTITSLLKYSRENFEIMLSGCDLPLSCLQSFQNILQRNEENEKDIRQTILELCLTLNNHRMSAGHLRQILLLFNSENPPMNQLLRYLLLLIQHQRPGPSQYLQFPVTGPATAARQADTHTDKNTEAHSLSVWKVAPLRMPTVSRIHWPVTNIGITISLWLQIETLRNVGREKGPTMNSWDSDQVVIVDIDHSVRTADTITEKHTSSAPYHHLVSIGTKRTMLQVWLDGGNLIFRVCVDPDDGRQVGVLAQTECNGLLLTNGEWQHLTLNYTENKLPDKTVLGKVHVIANCTTERDVILEHNVPKHSARSGSVHKKSSVHESKDVHLFVGHWNRPRLGKLDLGLATAYKLGTIMLFEGIHFTARSAFAIFRRGPNISNLTECLVSEIDSKNEKKSSASVSSRIRLSHSPSHVASSSSPLSPTPGLECGNNPQFFLLPHSLLLSDLVTEDFFSTESLPSVKNLQEHLVLSYSPTDPGMYMSNPTNVKAHEPDRRSKSFSLFYTASSQDSTHPENFDPLTQKCTKMHVKKSVKVKSQWNRGLHRALNQVGGIQVFLLLCAKVVEATSLSITQFSSMDDVICAEKIQCLALQALLKLRATDSKRQQEFSSLNVASMLHKLLTKSQCIVGFRTLQILFNAACSGDEVIINFDTGDMETLDADNFEVNFENSALLYDQELLQIFLTDWKIWHKSTDTSDFRDPDDKFPVWTMLLQAMLSLVRDEHPHHWFNSRALLRAGIMHRILTGLQQMVVENVNPFPGPSVTSHMMELLRAVISSPPNLLFLSKICDFLVATHPPASTFVCHTSSSFYFNLRLSNTQKGSVSQPISPPEKCWGDSDRPLMNRSASAPAVPSSNKNVVTNVLAEDNGSESQNNRKKTTVDKLQERKAKALSIIEEGNSSGSANSSRNTTPSRAMNRGFDSSPNTFATNSTQGEIGNDSSWEEVPHTVNPVMTSPKQSTSATTQKNEISEEESDFVTQLQAPPSGEFSSPKRAKAEQFEIDEHDELSYVICELLNLLFMAVMTMPDIDAFELTTGPLCAKALVVGVHHKSSQVRTATLRMLAAYFSRCSSKSQERFLREKGFHLVANQMHQRKATRPIIDACLYFLLGHPVSSAEILPLDGTAPDPGMLPTPAPDPFTNHTAVLLLAALGKTFHDAELCKDVITRLQELFECMGPIADVMLDNGLTLALCNLVTSVLCSDCLLTEAEKEGVLQEIEHFMTCIAVKACVTSGSAHFQVFEDLFTLLHIIENDQLKTSDENATKIQELGFNILMMVLELMKKSAGGKSPMVPRKYDSLHRGPPASLPVSSNRSSRRSSNSSMYSAAEIHNFQNNELSSPDSEHPPAFTDDRESSSRRSSLMTNAQKGQKFSHRRSLSTTHSAASDSSVFRSHGSLRTRSFKGSQRRRINEAETARRLQRVIMIAVDKLVFNELKSKPKTSDKDTTFATMPSHKIFSQESGVFQEDEKSDFGCRMFLYLLECLTVVMTGGQRRGTSSRFSVSSSSNLTTSSLSQGWERILILSRDSLLDQTVRLFVHLMSPWQSDISIRTLPMSIAQKQNAERLLTTLFPKDSKNGKKVSVYLHYLLCYYKQQMTPQQRKDVKLFCRLFHRAGHKIYPLPQNTNGVADENRGRRSSESNNHQSDVISQDDLAKMIEGSQEMFDNERQRDIKNWQNRNRSAYMQLKLRTDQLSQAVSQHAMEVTQQVVLRQNIERKKMTAHMKDVTANDLSVRKQWAGLLEQLAHERAVWFDENTYPKSWQLDATEGPNRERRRLQRCHLGIDERFMMKKSEDSKRREIERKKYLQERIREMVASPSGYKQEESSRVKEDVDENIMPKRPLSFLFEDDSHSSDSITIRTRLQTNERISVVQSCTHVTTSCETLGEVLIGESSMYFVGDEVISDLSLTQALFGECDVLVLSWRHEEVSEVHKRWWQLQDTAIEVFLTNGKTYLLAFKTAKERDIIVKRLKAIDLPNMLVQDNDLDSLTQMWRNGAMTNFEYLTLLNKAAGRSFNDLMQYPVMPFILADYTSAILDLNNVETFRNLLRPISVPDETRVKYYQDRYKYLSEDYNNCTDDEREMMTPPCHYGSHYSNSGTVLHFLVRLPPYTQMFLDYQDSSFDIPDRTFHSMETTFRLSSYSSTTDVKELVPEFFFLPEFLCNLEGFDFGMRQCGLRVNHVTLPPWSKTDPRLFTLIHRQALESDYVSANLHGWIDLMFGYKQMGKEAIEAVNVFHPATYFGMDVSSVEDLVKRRALETMIKTYGQTPKQLFSSPHSAKNIKSEMKDQVPQGMANNGSRRSSLVPPGRPPPMRQISQKIENKRTSTISIDSKSEHSRIMPQRPLTSVLGLTWGRYLGSPAAADPVVFLLKELSEPVGSLIPLQTNDVCALAPKMGLLVIYNQERGVRSYKTIDIKWSALLTYCHPDNIVRLKMKKALPDVNLFRTPADDRVTCCAVAPDCRAIVLGHKSGAITVNKCNPLPDKAFDLEFQRGTTLYGHFQEITCVVACGEFRILASGSKDGTVVLWDLDALTYIRSLTGHATAVSSMAISRTSGDVCTVCDSGNDDGSHIRLWTINGGLLSAQDTKHRVSCIAFSSAPEGISVNVIAGGMSNGIVRLWSSWDLNPIRDIEAPGVQNPISCLTFTHNSEVLYAATDNKIVIGWCFKDKVDDKQPILISFLNVGEKS